MSDNDISKPKTVPLNIRIPKEMDDEINRRLADHEKRTGQVGTRSGLAIYALQRGLLVMDVDDNTLEEALITAAKEGLPPRVMAAMASILETIIRESFPTMEARITDNAYVRVMLKLEEMGMVEFKKPDGMTEAEGEG